MQYIFRVTFNKQQLFGNTKHSTQWKGIFQYYRYLFSYFWFKKNKIPINKFSTFSESPLFTSDLADSVWKRATFEYIYFRVSKFSFQFFVRFTKFVKIFVQNRIFSENIFNNPFYFKHILPTFLIRF